MNEHQYFSEVEGDLDLFGCVKDSKAVEQYLKESIDAPEQRLFLRKLRSPVDPGDTDGRAATEESFLATRANVIDAFLNFLTQAKEEDRVIVHFSGHGSYEFRPKELWHLDPAGNTEHKSETIICCDSYVLQGGSRIPPIRDLELRWLLAQVAKNNPHIITLMDCCHSSGNTRDSNSPRRIVARFAKYKERKTRSSIDNFVFYQQDQESQMLLDTQTKDFQIPIGKHVALYACHSYQLAKETEFPEGDFGVFTYYLLQSLRATKGNISYRDLIKLIRAKATQEVTEQSPQSFATQGIEMNLNFLGGSVAQNYQHYTLRPLEKVDQGVLDAGSLHGIPSEKEGKTWLSIYPHNVDIQSVKKEDAIRGYLIQVNAEKSIVKLEEGNFPPGVPFFKAFITATPLPKTKVYIETEIDEVIVRLPENAISQKEMAMKYGRDLLEGAIGKNPFLELVDKGENWQYRLFVYHFEGKEKYRIAQKDEVKALINPQEGFSNKSAQAIVNEMAHIARWERTLNLENPQNSIIQPGDIELTVLDSNDQFVTNPAGEIILHQIHEEANNTWSKPSLKFKVVMNNKEQIPLYCALVHLTPDFAINPNYLPADTHLGSKAYTDHEKFLEWERWEAYAGSHIRFKGKANKTGIPLQFSVPDVKFDRGIHEVEDHFKLIVSTEQFDPMHLYQGKLNDPMGDRNEVPPEIKSQLDVLMNEVKTRNAEWAIHSQEVTQSDWWTTLVTVKTRRVVNH